MKKAKDYAADFLESPSSKTLLMICNSFVREIEELRNTRGVTTNAGMLSILDEQDRKWRAFARRVDGIKDNGFDELVKQYFTPVYEVWRAG